MIQSGDEETLFKSSNFFDKDDSLIYKEKELCELKGFTRPNKKSSNNCSTSSLSLFKPSKKEFYFNSKREELKGVIQRNIFKGISIPKVIQKELFLQELSFDEKLDYVSVKIPIPKHMDFLIV